MRLLILGAGGVGGYFGARLAAADVDVTFLVRPPRAVQLDSAGLIVHSPLGDLRLRVKTLTQAVPGFDVVIVACKAFDLEAALKAIAPAVESNTLILPLLNGMRHLEVLDARFGSERVLGGLCAIGTTLNEKGEVQHLNRLQQFIVGPRLSIQTERCRSLHATLMRGGFSPTLSDVVLQDMWEKFVMLTTFAGMTCLMRAPIGVIVATNEGEKLANEMLAECIAVAGSRGYSPRAEFVDRTRSMLTKHGSRETASMFRDVQRDLPTEHDHIVGDMLIRARESGVPSPLLRVAYAHLQAYEAARLTVGN